MDHKDSIGIETKEVVFKISAMNRDDSRSIIINKNSKGEDIKSKFSNGNLLEGAERSGDINIKK